jgi:hypothetical protein
MLPTFCVAGLTAEFEEGDEFFLHAWKIIRRTADVKVVFKK